MATPNPQQQPTTPPPTPEELAAIREAERKQKTITATVIAGIRHVGGGELGNGLVGAEAPGTARRDPLAIACT